VSPENPRVQVRVFIDNELVNLPEQCVGDTYYTSLPAKCHTADGRLVRVGGVKTGVPMILESR